MIEYTTVVLRSQIRALERARRYNVQAPIGPSLRPVRSVPLAALQTKLSAVCRQ